MNQLATFVKRNIKIFFRDRGLFFVSLITPVILLILYITFLGTIFKSSFMETFPAGMQVDEGILNGLVGGQLISSLLAVVPITVAFCANMVCPQDKMLGVVDDFMIAPTSRVSLGFSYFIATFICDLIISSCALVGGLIYIRAIGWYLSGADVVRTVLAAVLLCVFGSALSSVINSALKSQGAMSAVGSLVSSVYGFICGAYMPLASFGKGLRDALMFLPGTYGTSLLRNALMTGPMRELASRYNLPASVIESFKDATDGNIYFSGNPVPSYAKYIVLGCAAAGCCLLMCIVVVAGGKKKRG